MDLLKNLKDLHLGQGEHKASETGTTAPPPTAAPKQDNLFDKINSVLSDKPSTPPATSVAHPQEPHHKESVMDKFTNSILGNDARKYSPPPPTVAHPQQQRHESSSLFDKLGDQVSQAISGHKTPEPAPGPAPAKEEHLFDKITGVLSGKPEHQQPQRPQTLSEKLSGKINDALGGGQKAEMKEDKLDKGEYMTMILHEASFLIR
jgi:hypothetical protein